MNGDQLAAFRADGIVALSGALRREQYEPVRAHVLQELRRLGITSGGKAKSSAIKQLPMFQQIGRLSQSIRYDGLREKLVRPELLQQMRKLAGHAALSAQDPQLLISPPHQGEWTLTGLNWHVDVAPPPDGRSPGVQMFALIDDVAPHGGGTLAVAGSQTMRRGGREYGELVEALRQGEAGMERLVKAGCRLVEMSGKAGDVYLMDLRVLHSPSVNESAMPRLMATARYFVGA